MDFLQLLKDTQIVETWKRDCAAKGARPAFLVAVVEDREGRPVPVVMKTDDIETSEVARLMKLCSEMLAGDGEVINLDLGPMPADSFDRKGK